MIHHSQDNPIVSPNCVHSNSSLNGSLKLECNKEYVCLLYLWSCWFHLISMSICWHKITNSVKAEGSRSFPDSSLLCNRLCMKLAVMPHALEALEPLLARGLAVHVVERTAQWTEQTSCNELSLTYGHLPHGRLQRLRWPTKFTILWKSVFNNINFHSSTRYRCPCFPKSEIRKIYKTLSGSKPF